MDTKDKVLFYVVRHGETALNKKGAFRGPIDVPLNDEGRKQARGVAKILKNKPITILIHSNKKRSKETAKIIARGHKKVPIVGTDKLQAWNLGTFAGKPKDKANLKKLKEYVDHPDKKVPKGESLNDFKHRVDPVIDDVIYHASAGHLPVVVAHSSIIHELGKIINGDEKSSLVEPGGIVAVVEKGKKLKAIPIHREDGIEPTGFTS